MRDPAFESDEEPRGVGGRDADGIAPRAASAFAERRWSIVAAFCLVAAVVLWMLVGVDAAFVVATFGVLAWFWDQRNRIERRGGGSGGRRGAYADDDDEDFADEDEGEAGDEIDDDDEKPRDLNS